MGEDDPAYGNEEQDEQTQYGGSTGDEESAIEQTERRENGDQNDGEGSENEGEGDEESLGQDETDPE